MKKTLFSLMLVTALGMTSCTHIDVESHANVKSKELEMEVIVIDHCEYLFRNWDRGALFTHKGNCNNPIHYKQVKDSIQ